MMDYDLIRLALTVINMVATAIVGLFVLQNRRQQVTLTQIKSAEIEHRAELSELRKQVEHRFAEKCTRLYKLEERVADLPSKRDIVRIHERLDTLQRTFNNDLKQMQKDNGDNFQAVTLSLGELIGATKAKG